jgi:DNA-binding response OmpR family regulator
VDADVRCVEVGGERTPLTPRELDLLTFFMRNPGQAFSRADLLSAVWQSSTEWQDPSTVTVHLRRLRAKIELDPDNPRHLLTVWGDGYRFAS